MNIDHIKYDVIVVDPPWPINHCMNLKNFNNRKKPIGYDQMSLKNIVDLPIVNLCSDNCIMFLWVTHAMLPAGLNCLMSWGFKYHILLTWHKRNGINMYGFTRNSELILVGYKGNGMGNCTQKGIKIPTVFSISSKSLQHSQKPDWLYDMIYICYEGTRLSLFERFPRRGFDCWGNEYKNSVDLSWAGLCLL